MSPSALTSAMPAPFGQRANLRTVWWLSLGMGVISVIIGMLAISSVFVATMASVFVFGLLLIIEGIASLIYAVMVRHWEGFGLYMVASVVYLMLGLFMLENPLRAAAVLTLVFAAAFFTGGLVRIILSLVERFTGWPWVLLNGVINLLLGALILREWPGSSLWVIGLFVGIDLLLHGWSWIFLAFSLKTNRATAAA
jgi:uncharacterized membrane protein HdeD (DUF308 family)